MWALLLVQSSVRTPACKRSVTQRLDITGKPVLRQPTIMIENQAPEEAHIVQCSTRFPAHCGQPEVPGGFLRCGDPPGTPGRTHRMGNEISICRTAYVPILRHPGTEEIGASLQMQASGTDPVGVGIPTHTCERRAMMMIRRVEHHLISLASKQLGNLATAQTRHACFCEHMSPSSAALSCTVMNIDVSQAVSANVANQGLVQRDTACQAGFSPLPTDMQGRDQPQEGEQVRTVPNDGLDMVEAISTCEVLVDRQQLVNARLFTALNQLRTPRRAQVRPARGTYPCHPSPCVATIATKRWRRMLHHRRISDLLSRYWPAPVAAPPQVRPASTRTFHRDAESRSSGHSQHSQLSRLEPASHLLPSQGAGTGSNTPLLRPQVRSVGRHSHGASASARGCQWPRHYQQKSLPDSF